MPGGGFPAVIVVHGGPESQYLPQYRADVQYLVDCGYAVLAPNIRGSTGLRQCRIAAWTTFACGWTASRT